MNQLIQSFLSLSNDAKASFLLSIKKERDMLHEVIFNKQKRKRQIKEKNASDKAIKKITLNKDGTPRKLRARKSAANSQLTLAMLTELTERSKQGFSSIDEKNEYMKMIEEKYGVSLK